MYITFTKEELQDLRRFDAMVDNSPMSHEDYLISDLVEELLFPDPERAKQREANRRRYEQCREQRLAYSREYRAAHKEQEKKRKRAWYQANRERILARQKANRRIKAEA